MRARQIINAAFALVACCLTISAQDQSQKDPLEQRFQEISGLLALDRPADAERKLKDLGLRANSSKFNLGKATISTYVFVSMLLITTYSQMGDLGSAERVANDRIEWAQNAYGPESRQQAGFIDLLAETYRIQGKYKEAEPLYKRSLSIKEAQNMATCLITHSTYTGLAEAYVAQKRPRDAEALLKPAIESCKEKSFALPDLLNVYSIALEEDQQPKQSADAEHLADSFTPPEPRFRQEDRDLLRARLAMTNGRADEAISLCKKWIAIMEVPDGPESDRRLMLPLSEGARILRRAGRDSEAAELTARLNQIRKKYNARF
jgi:tetratricopeptide (TPR) repeat protein